MTLWRKSMMLIQVYVPFTQEHFEGSLAAVTKVVMQRPYLVETSQQRPIFKAEDLRGASDRGLTPVIYSTDDGQMAFNFATTGLSVELQGKPRE